MRAAHWMSVSSKFECFCKLLNILEIVNFSTNTFLSEVIHEIPHLGRIWSATTHEGIS